MEERFSAAGRPDDFIDLGRHIRTLFQSWSKITLICLAAGVVTFIFLLMKQNVYQASAVIAPPPQERRENPGLGMLASFGINVGGATRVEDLEALFRSDDLTVRVFGKHNLWLILYKDRYDPVSGKIRRSWIERLSGKNGSDVPGEWDAIRAAKERLRVLVNRRAGTVTISFDSPSPAGSAEIVKHYLEEGRSRLQEEALNRAVKNKKFIEEQIGKTMDALTRDRLYSLLGHEVEQEMMARNREQFGFRVIDSPRAPDRKIRPRRLYNAGVSMFLALIGSWVFFCIRENGGSKNVGGLR
ncbi:MAG: Wzz/FepE/Etk N-terminal domain-containing protein [Syntrophorhabdaceae bacterium]|nr:Wzz/FepE/Etk N-terminal domain-containing protein [Syntrophorhabdaceae bacterium]